MRQFARPFPLERLSLEARVLYTAFLVFLLAGMFSAVWLYRSSFGDLSSRSTSTYYLGEAAAEEAGDDGGPALDLPEEAAVGALSLGQSPRQVMETFHFHLFTVPVVLLIVGHIFMLTSLSTRWKVGIILLSSAATFLHLLAPLLVRFGGEGWAFLFPASVVAAGLGWLPMTVWPIWEMWRRLPEQRGAGRAEAA